MGYMKDWCIRIYGGGESLQIAITEEERSVLATVRDIYASQGDDECDRIAEVIDGLLERMK
jgi:hypothetical protein